MENEKAIQNEILDWLKLEGIFAWPIYNGAVFDVRRGSWRSQGKHYVRGVSDIIGIHKGRMFAIEVKTKTGRVSNEQAVFFDKVNACGGRGVVARCLDDVKAFFEEDDWTIM